jgi:Flp pilus assembly protein TadG
MKRLTRSCVRCWRRAWRDRRGVSSLMFAASATVIFGMAALGVDVGVALSARAALQANTDAAVLDAAEVWSNSGSQTSASTAATGWHTSNTVPLTSSVTPSTPTFSCLTTTSGLPNCSSSAPNVIGMQQTAQVPTFFARLFGIDSWTVSAAAAAAKAGGPTKALNVMFVLDTTRSMGTGTDDTGCRVPGVSSPTRLTCALYGVQLVLKQLNPALDQVGLIVFPGMSSTWAPCGSPQIEAYGTPNIVYQMIHNVLDTNYATTTGTLNDSSSLVETVGDNANGLTGCIEAPGGEGTYYAQAIATAQAALQSEGSASAQNVIILFSDGAATATAQDMNSTYATSACSPSTVCVQHDAQECNQAVYQAQQATAAGTWVYAIAYDSPTTSSSSGCSSLTVTTGSGKSARSTTVYDSPTGTNVNVWSPCTAMQNIASSLANFFSTDSACQDGPNTYTDVASAFQQAGVSLSAPRLVLY